MKKLIFITNCILLITLMGCTRVSEDDLTETITPIEFVTYDGSIKAIMDNNCVFCHNSPPVNGANTSLKTYTDVKTLVDPVVDRISRQSGEGGAMPNGLPRLPQNMIDLVEQWKADGLLEN